MNSLKHYDSLIFTHIPKCGGTSFREFIHLVGLDSKIPSNQIHTPGVGGLDDNKNIIQLTEEELTDFKSRKIKILADHSLYNIHSEYFLNMYNVFYYTILREPVARFLSHYNFFYKELGYKGLKGQTLNELSDAQLDELILSLANLQLNYCIRSRKQGWQADESWLRQAKFNLKDVYGCFGLLEEVDNSVTLLNAYSPEWMTVNRSLPKRNKNKETTDIPEPRIIERIKEHNYFDLKFYEFAKETFHRRLKGM